MKKLIVAIVIVLLLICTAVWAVPRRRHRSAGQAGCRDGAEVRRNAVVRL